MDIKRRRFVNLSAAVGVGSLLGASWACNGAKNMTDPMQSMGRPSLKAFGLQLYTLRDIIEDDPKSVIKEVGSYGFTQIEGYDGPQGMFWNMGHKGFKSYLDGLGLDMISSHCDIKENFEEKAAQAAEIGMKYLICPHIGPQKSVEAWKDVCDLFNRCGEICRKNGIKFAYHNHAYTFKAFTGMIPHDFLMENTDPDLVDHQMDIYWVVTGGADPIEYLEKYPNRFTLCHVKDRMKNAGDERSASCNLGTGSIDFSRILKVAQANGMKYFIMEQERYDNSTPLKSAEAGAKYLKNLVFA